VIGAVAGRSMSVNPAGVPRKEAIEGRHQVCIRSGAQLDDDNAGRRVRDEHDQQAVTLSRDEPFASSGQIVQPALTSGLDRQFLGLQSAVLRRLGGHDARVDLIPQPRADIRRGLA
jgi:hypothetical protein